MPDQKIENLRNQLSTKWQELEKTLAASLGYSFEKLNSEQRQSLSEEVMTALNDWDEADNSANGGGLHPKTDLQKALDEYLRLSEKISFREDGIDIDD